MKRDKVLKHARSKDKDKCPWHDLTDLVKSSSANFTLNYEVSDSFKAV